MYQSSINKKVFFLCFAFIIFIINKLATAEPILIQDIEEEYNQIYNAEINNNKDIINKAQTLPIKAFFTPWDNIEKEIINNINQAKHSIYIQTHLWNSKLITDAIINAKKRSVAIYILANQEQMLTTKNSQIKRLINAGIALKLEVKYQNANNRIMIIDYNTKNAVLITGSYDFNYRSQHSNSENILVIQDKNLSKTYYDNWQRHSKKAILY